MRRFAWAAVALGLLIAVAPVAHAQEDVTGVQLHRNYPNPFNTETTIPFTLSQELWSDGEAPLVSLRIYNILAQLVAIPVFKDSEEPVDSVEVPWNGTGEYEAHWDGKVDETGQEAAAGVYIYQLEVDGKVYQRTMTIEELAVDGNVYQRTMTTER